MCISGAQVENKSELIRANKFVSIERGAWIDEILAVYSMTSRDNTIRTLFQCPARRDGAGLLQGVREAFAPLGL